MIIGTAIFRISAHMLWRVGATYYGWSGRAQCVLGGYVPLWGWCLYSWSTSRRGVWHPVVMAS